MEPEGAARSTREPDEVEALRTRIASAEQEIERLRAAMAHVQEREAALGLELQRRVRNLLASIRSVLRRSLDSGTDGIDVARHFQGRLDAIACYQSGLRALAPGGIELEDIIRDQLHAVGVGDDPSVTIAGPPVVFRDRTVELMTLAVHELTTNAIKFGALAGGGRLAVEWEVVGARILLAWRETETRASREDARPRGFGQQFIEDALPYELEAITRFAPEAGAFTCTIDMPIVPAP